MSTFASRLKELRNKKEWSQRDLSLRIDVIQQTIASWEKGKGSPDDTTKIRLADLFGVSLDYLLGRTDDPNLFQRDKNIAELRDGKTSYGDLNKDQVPPNLIKIGKDEYGILEFSTDETNLTDSQKQMVQLLREVENLPKEFKDELVKRLVTTFQVEQQIIKDNEKNN